MLWPGDNVDYLNDNFAFMCYTYNLLCSRLTNGLMIAHCTKGKFSILQIPVFIFGLILNVYFVLVHTKPDLFTASGVHSFFLAFFVSVILYYSTYIYSVVNILAEALDIKVFRIPHEKKAL